MAVTGRGNFPLAQTAPRGIGHGRGFRVNRLALTKQSNTAFVHTPTIDWFFDAAVAPPALTEDEYRSRTLMGAGV